LYRLLANPDYIEPLRQEVDAVINEEGWTKAGIDKMHKIDSFLRESQRLDDPALCSFDSFFNITRNADIRAPSFQWPGSALRYARSHFPMV
jgi:Cytochrome P450